MDRYKKAKGRIIVVSNRLPIAVSKRKGVLKIQPSPGGLATCLRSLGNDKEVIFVGWPGCQPASEKEKLFIRKTLEKEHHCYPVFLSQSEINKYYYGFTNKAIWPLFHYFATYSIFEASEWKSYEKVNRKFFQKIYKLARPADIFWIHDYHLMLLPALLRGRIPKSSIGFFLHIPFPSSEIFRIFPWRVELLDGLLGADLIGFHTYEYARHFLSSVMRLLGYEHEFADIHVGDRIVHVENFPMGINIQSIEALLQNSKVKKGIQKLKSIPAHARKIILSVDRLDYTKGIPQRLRGLELFLENNPTWHNRFIHIMICVPSRTRVKHYALLKEEVEGLVGRINGRFASPGWIPIHYIYRSLPFEDLLPLYAVADVALITPLRDGMNLVAKEFVASKFDNRGILILSETAGAVAELGESLIVNVNNQKDIAGAIKQALEMNETEQKKGMDMMRRRLREFDVDSWSRSFIDRLYEVKDVQKQRERQKLNEIWTQKLLSEYARSRRRLLLLDYDGTLVSFAKKPEQAMPDTGLKRLLVTLSKNFHNTLVIVSGRDRITLEQWLGRIPCGLVAEHGAWWKRSPDQDWIKQVDISDDWKGQLRPILKTYELRVPGSFVEEKEFSIAWHYRKASPELGQFRSNELFDNLSEFLANMDLQVMHGNKVIEVRVQGVNKGVGVMPWLSQGDWDFILALGDDWTDEDLFKVLPKTAYSIKVNYGPTEARFFLDSPQSTRDLLRKLAKIK
ncbi:MAG: bifunctional alpha,alpha-trehalose-phosphate synthase (UDP-forming)/trehalose-phosphatase [Candidatus Aminicenantes bacterium]|nr:bifunctional alpha,alpha-trehalose-phosphate synthase (UDP-forming)/trehalose-phosphatase [Candidatus Aminicenantes bacterium]